MPSDPEDRRPPLIREQTTREVVQPGFLGTITEIGRALVTGMPPGLLVVSLLFGGVIYFLDSSNDQRFQAMTQRTELVGKLLTMCLERVQPPQPH